MQWYRGQYIFSYFHSPLENDSPDRWEQFGGIEVWGPGHPCVRSMTPDWTIGSETCSDLSLEGQTATDLIEHQGSLIAIHQGHLLPNGDPAPQNFPAMFLWSLDDNGEPMEAPIRKEHFTRSDGAVRYTFSNLVSIGEFLMESANTVGQAITPALVTPTGRVGTRAAEHGVGESSVDARTHTPRSIIWTGEESVVAYWQSGVWIVRSSPAGFVDPPVRIGQPVRVSEGTAENRSVKMVWNGEKLAVVWTGRGPDDLADQVYFRSFDAQLNPLQPPIRLGTSSMSLTTGNDHPHPVDITWDGREFVVVWADDIRGFVFARGRFDCF